MISQRYRVVERIARGGMGEVYVAEHVEMKQLVAVKFLHKRYAHDESFAARFFNEARYAAQVTHPNAVALYDFGRLDDGTLFIVMEYVRGESLSRVVRAQKMIPVPMAIRVASQVAEVLASAHEKRIIHRDVKPDNIMLVQGAGGRVSVKVLDFGIAKILDDEDGHHTEPGVMFGTPEYMSPEQAMGRSYDHRVDVYALGLVLYYMLAGSPPFSGQNKMAVLQAQVQEEPPQLERSAKQPIPRRLVRLIDSMLAKSPDERPADMIAVFKELDEILTLDDVEADIVESIPVSVAQRPQWSASTGTEQAASSRPDEALFFEGPSGAARHEATASAPVPQRSPSKIEDDGYAPLKKSTKDEAERFAAIRKEAEDPYTLTGIQLVVSPLTMKADADERPRRFRVESGWLMMGAVALCSLIVFLALAFMMQRSVKKDAPTDVPAQDLLADANDEVMEGEALPEAVDAPEVEEVSRYASQLTQAETALRLGDLRGAKDALSSIPVTDAPTGFAPLRSKIVRAETLLRDLEIALTRSRCDDARELQANLSSEVSEALADRQNNAIQSCSDRVAAATARPPAASAVPNNASRPSSPPPRQAATTAAPSTAAPTTAAPSAPASAPASTRPSSPAAAATPTPTPAAKPTPPAASATPTASSTPAVSAPVTPPPSRLPGDLEPTPQPPSTTPPIAREPEPVLPPMEL